MKQKKGIKTMSEELLEIPTFLKKLSERDKKEKPQKSRNQKQTRISDIDGSLLELNSNGFWWAVKTEDTKQSKKDRDVELIKYLATLVNTGLKKKPLIAKMREKFTKLTSAQICRFINNQLKLKVIEIDKKYKTKPVVIKGKYWRTN